MKAIRKMLCVLALGAASLMMSAGTSADQWPLVSGCYWEVTGIKDYKIFSNEFARAGEPDLYLVRITESVVSGAEAEKRQAEYMEWQKKSIAQMSAESGNRAEYREVTGTSLLQEMTFRS